MKALVRGILLILMASSLRAQVTPDCPVAECPQKFMPSPIPPSSAAKKRVETVLAAVSIAEQKEDNAEESLRIRLAVIKAELLEKTNRFMRWTIDDNAVMSAALSDPDYLFIQGNLRTAIHETYLTHNAAIRETMDVYQLFPPITDFSGDSRAAGVNMVAKAFLPHYSRHEKRDKETGQWRKRTDEELAKEKIDNSIVGGDAMAARTRGNGVMEFYGQAFKSADDLAIWLYHETSHWVDIAGKSGGFKGSDPPSVSFRTEQHAYERAAIFAAKLGLSGQYHTNSAKQFKLQADQAEKENLTWDQITIRYPKWIGRDRPGALALAPAESELSSEDEALLQQMMAKAQALAAAQARKQSEFAQRDHDERLKAEWTILAHRSCDFPGSVGQSELDRLPRLNKREVVDNVKLMTGNCYDRVYWMLYTGGTAEDIKKLSTPIVPVNPFQPKPTMPAEVIAGKSFGHIFPDLKFYAEMACKYQGNIPIPAANTILVPPVRHTLLPGENAAAAKIIASLGRCEGHVFRRLFEMLREERGAEITTQWFMNTVASTPATPPPSQGGGYVSPPQGGGGRNPCQRGNDPFGCQRPHP